MVGSVIVVRDRTGRIIGIGDGDRDVLGRGVAGVVADGDRHDVVVIAGGAAEIGRALEIRCFDETQVTAGIDAEEVAIGGAAGTSRKSVEEQSVTGIGIGGGDRRHRRGVLGHVQRCRCSTAVAGDERIVIVNRRNGDGDILRVDATRAVADLHLDHLHIAIHRVERIRFGREITRCVFEDGRWKLELSDGTERIYRDTESSVGDEELAGHPVRNMDCIDCHNRPTHHYNPPARLINTALKNGLVDDDLPGAKGLLVGLMEAEYATEDEALAAIDAGVRAYYGEEYPELMAARAADVEEAIATLEQDESFAVYEERTRGVREIPVVVFERRSEPD